SSRRRHTIFSRDWSSDVCSSDLDHLLGALDDLADGRLGVVHGVQLRGDALGGPHGAAVRRGIDASAKPKRPQAPAQGDGLRLTEIGNASCRQTEKGARSKAE